VEKTDTYTETRAHLYRLLASVYRREPTPDLLRDMTTYGLLDVLSDAGYSLTPPAGKSDPDGVIAELECEFTRLFLGPGPRVSPHESVHSARGKGKGLLWGEVTAEVKKFIEYYGLEYSQDFKEMPDHLSIELEFMAKLIDKESELRSKGDIRNAEHCLRVQREFFTKHLSSWVTGFCDEVIARAEIPFYKEISRFLQDVMLTEDEFFHELSLTETT
jgi:DMSO reductase family type II enzyme chaperone